MIRCRMKRYDQVGDRNFLISVLSVFLFVFLLSTFFLLYSLTDTPEYVLLSFDVEPVDGADSVIGVLEVLDHTGTQATFFFTGEYAEQYPEIVRQVFSAGHEIACHGYSHKSFTLMGVDEKKKEIALCESRLFDLTGEVPSGFRAPYNRIDDETYSLLEGRFVYDASQVDGLSFMFPETVMPEVMISSIFHLPAEDVVWLYYLHVPASTYFRLLEAGSGHRSYLFHPHHMSDPRRLEKLESFIKDLSESNVTFIKHLDFILLQNDNS